MSALAMLGICLATAPVVALSIVTAPLQQTLAVMDDFGEQLGHQTPQPPAANFAATAASGEAHAPTVAANAGTQDLLLLQRAALLSQPPRAKEPSAAKEPSSAKLSSAKLSSAKLSSAKLSSADLSKVEEVSTASDALPAPQPIPTLSIRRDAPHCENVYVYIVTDLVAGGAVATMAIGEKSRGRQRRVGHRLGDYEVIAIGSLGFGRGPAVWLSQGEHVCVAPMSADNPVRQRQLKARLAKERAKAKRKAKAERKSKAKKRARRRAKRRAR